MPTSIPAAPLVLSAFLMVPPMLLSCGGPCGSNAQEEKDVRCEASGAITVTAPSRLDFSAGVPSNDQLGYACNTSPLVFIIEKGIVGKVDTFHVGVTRPPNAGTATYVLPSPDVRIVATIRYCSALPDGCPYVLPSPDAGPDGFTHPLTVTSGTINVESASACGLEASVNIQFESDAQEAYSVAGHVTVNTCYVQTTCVTVDN